MDPYLPDVRSLLLASFEEVSYSFGDTIVAEGDEAEALYIITAGRARVLKRGTTGSDVPLGTVRAGDCVGEAALLEGGLRTATVRASGAVEALRLARPVFDALVRANPAISDWAKLVSRNRAVERFLRLDSVLAVLPSEVLTAVAANLKETALDVGEVAIREGDPPGSIYFVEEGQLRVSRSDGTVVGYLSRGDVFGERAFLLGEARSSTVETLTPCRFLELPTQRLSGLTEAHPDLRAHFEERAARYDFRTAARVPLGFAIEDIPAEARLTPPELEVEDVARSLGASISESAISDFVRPSQKIRRFAVVWQIDEADCGQPAWPCSAATSASGSTRSCPQRGRNRRRGHHPPRHRGRG